MTKGLEKIMADLQTINVTTTAAGDVVIALFAGTNWAGMPPSGITKGDESTEIFNDVVDYATGTYWGVCVENQIANVSGDVPSTFSNDPDVNGYNFMMSIAFKRPTNPVPYTQIPLSTETVRVWTSNSKLSPYIPRIEFFDEPTKTWVIATTENFVVDPQQILSNWEQGGMYRAVKIGDAVVVQWFSEITNEWENQYLVDPDFVRPDPSGVPAGVP